MFKDLLLAEWTQGIAAVAFVASFAVFVFFLVGAIRMPKGKIQHDASLPLEEEKRS